MPKLSGMKGNLKKKKVKSQFKQTIKINYGRNAFSLEKQGHMTTSVELLLKGLDNIHAR